jgi:hypothetical protein
MARTRMWVFESDQYGMTENKFHMDDPLHIPRVGEFVDSNKAGGWVTHVQYNYNLGDKVEFCLVVNVSLSKTK